MWNEKRFHPCTSADIDDDRRSERL